MDWLEQAHRSAVFLGLFMVLVGTRELLQVVCLHPTTRQVVRRRHQQQQLTEQLQGGSIGLILHLEVVEVAESTPATHIAQAVLAVFRTTQPQQSLVEQVAQQAEQQAVLLLTAQQQPPATGHALAVVVVVQTLLVLGLLETEETADGPVAAVAEVALHATEATPAKAATAEMDWSW